MAKALAVVGAAVTLIGVAFLLAIAISAGIFGPLARTVSGGLLALVLLTTGLLIQRRTGRVSSALGVTATGIAAAYLDIVAMTAVYDYVPTVVGLALAAVVAIGGLVVARRWSSELLAILVVLGVALLAPAVGGGDTAVVAGFLVLLTVVSTTVHVGQPRWPALELARTIPTSLYLAGAILLDPAERTELTVLAVVLGVAMLTITTVAARAPHLGLLSAAPLVFTSAPALVGGDHLAGWSAVAVLGAIGLLHLAAAVLAGPQTTRPAVDQVRFWANGIGSAFLVAAVLRDAFADWSGTALLVIAVLHLARARVDRGAIVGWVAVGVAAIALVQWASRLDALVYAYRAASLQVDDLIDHALVIVVAVLLTQVGPGLVRRVGGGSSALTGAARRLWVAGLVLALAAVSGVVVTAAVLLARDPATQHTAFQVGHAIATLTWLGIAAWLLMRGLGPSRSAGTAMRVGLWIAVGAVVKLFLFDMSSLDSLSRVLSFIPAGLILLGMGAGYAKALERVRSRQQ